MLYSIAIYCYMLYFYFLSFIVKHFVIFICDKCYINTFYLLTYTLFNENIQEHLEHGDHP